MNNESQAVDAMYESTSTIPEKLRPLDGLVDQIGIRNAHLVEQRQRIERVLERLRGSRVEDANKGPEVVASPGVLSSLDHALNENVERAMALSRSIEELEELI